MHSGTATDYGNPPVDSSAFRRRASHLNLSEDPDTATLQTVQEMCRQISAAAEDPLVQRCAARALQFRGGPLFHGSPIQMQAESCWWWCKHYLRFKHHERMFEVWSADLGDPRTKMQLLISPDVLVRMNRWEGDCAIYTMMLCAMLRALGVRYQVCPAAVDHAQPGIFSHVFARCILENGATESLDASHGRAPGWQVPPEDLMRLWVFDQNGNRIAEYGGRFNGLHAYRRRGLRPNGARTFFGRGLAQADDIQEGGSYTPPTGLNPTEVYGSDVGFDWGGIPRDTSTGGYQAPSQSSAQWATFASNLAKMGFTIAEINAIQPGTVVSPNGAILRQNPGYSVPVGTSASLNLGSSSSILYIALGLGGLFLVGSMLKK